MILIIDNYDSFTYNLYQVFLNLKYEIKVVRNDKITIEEIEKLNPTHIILSPGPGTPDDAGICVEVVRKLKGKFPILGVCLGHQSILNAFDVPIVRADRIVHGKVEKMHHNGNGVFRNLPDGFLATRYHSLCAKEDTIPDSFIVSCKAEDGEVMAVEHKEYCLVGLQFHPESIGTKEGEKLIKNFLNYRRDNVPIKKYLQDLLNQTNLKMEQTIDIMDELTEGNLHDAQIASMLTSMQIKGVTSEELAGFASVLKKKAASFPKPSGDEKRLDIVGTGGSKAAKTFNVSTIVSMVACACGAKVVKHGNRAVTSKSGSADLLEKLGINIEMTPEKSFEVYNNLGLTFLYARKFHSAMRFAGPTRRALGFRTAFNLIGPLSNPAYATHQLVGVFSEEYTERFCETLKLLGVERAMVVHGEDGLDEISLSSPTKISELINGEIKTYIFNPEEIGLKLTDHDELAGGDVERNKEICMDIMNGKDSPKLDLVCLNAGAALYIYGITDSIKSGFEKAMETVKAGKVKEVLSKFIELSN